MVYNPCLVCKTGKPWKYTMWAGFAVLVCCLYRCISVEGCSELVNKRSKRSRLNILPHLDSYKFDPSFLVWSPPELPSYQLPSSISKNYRATARREYTITARRPPSVTPKCLSLIACEWFVRYCTAENKHSFLGPVYGILFNVSAE
jgi:hypothetical protein